MTKNKVFDLERCSSRDSVSSADFPRSKELEAVQLQLLSDNGQYNKVKLRAAENMLFVLKRYVRKFQNDYNC